MSSAEYAQIVVKVCYQFLESHRIKLLTSKNILTLKLPITTIVVCFVMCSFCFLKVIFANSVDPDQIVPPRAF